MSPRHGLPPEREPSASMTLLDEVYRRPLDPGYREASRQATGASAHRPASRWVSLLLAALLGLAVTAA
ncbi:MAG: DUF881 domain-containing protein, partial [Cellulomonas sp.]|nr:DUF881 domain-containing protein [Cellulomonas sp.]